MPHLFVGWVKIFRNGKEFFLDHTRACKAEHGVRRTSLVIRAARSTSAKALLTDERGCGLAI